MPTLNTCSSYQVFYSFLYVLCSEPLAVSFLLLVCLTFLGFFSLFSSFLSLWLLFKTRLREGIISSESLLYFNAEVVDESRFWFLLFSERILAVLWLVGDYRAQHQGNYSNFYFLNFMLSIFDVFQRSSTCLATFQKSCKFVCHFQKTSTLF